MALDLDARAEKNFEVQKDFRGCCGWLIKRSALVSQGRRSLAHGHVMPRHDPDLTNFLLISARSIDDGRATEDDHAPRPFCD